jgi:hypothetical protein
MPNGVFRRSRLRSIRAGAKNPQGHFGSSSTNTPARHPIKHVLSPGLHKTQHPLAGISVPVLALGSW